MLQSLHKELELRRDELGGEPIETIYFGGGTPTVLELGEITSLIDQVYRHFSVSANPEITLEANPDDLAIETISALSQSAVNRLSIGVQSFYDEDLKFMNRAHSAVQAKSAIESAAGRFGNISIDLIYGIPGLDDARWLSNIQTALAFNVPHISSYALTVEPRTVLASFIKKGLVPPLDDALAERQFHTLVKVVEAQGFVNYEISNFGKPGYFSKNNTAYWQGKKYIGIGPSAHSFDGKRRGWNVRNNNKYIKALSEGVVPLEHEVLSTKDRYNEYMMTGLRTIWGVSFDRVKHEFGPGYLNYLKKQAQRHLEQRLLFLDGDTLLVTKRGRFLADGIAADLFMLNLSE